MLPNVVGSLLIYVPIVSLLVSPFAVLAQGRPIQQVSAKTTETGGRQLGRPWIRKAGDTRADGVIVFVHGVLGDARTTWSNGRTYWPELLTRDSTFDGQDIYVYAYPSPIRGRSFTIDEVADNLRLVLSTDGVLRYKTITFVCHSMGGIVTRAFILKYREQTYHKIRFLYFFATPTAGSPYAVLAAIVSQNPQFDQMYPMNSDTYLGPLQSNWLAAHLNLKSYCAYETLPMFGRMIVDRQSATQLCTERLDPMDANHVDIVKPMNPESTAYRALKSAFEETRAEKNSAAKVAAITTPNRVPSITATATSEVVARVYTRGVAPGPSSRTEYEPFLQELFYDWTVTLRSTEHTSEVIVTIRDSLPIVDRVRVVPEQDVAISDSTPKWLSGYVEPRAADYFTRTVRLSKLSKGSPISVTLRRPFKFQQMPLTFSAAEFARSFDIASPGCRVQKSNPDPTEQASRIMSHLTILANWRYSGADRPSPPIKKDPDSPDEPVVPGEIEVTVEVRCKDSSCGQIVIGKMEARRPLR